jgi:23S rRNA (adenine2503-C2)-methyltransferase
MPVDARTDLKALPRPALERWAVETLGLPRYRGEQLFRWIQARSERSFDSMTDLPKPLRERLLTEARLGGLDLEEVKVAQDGTKKLLLRTWDGQRVESVVIPMADRLTQCVSSQVGCKIGCDFCLTARMPVRRNLTASEIVDQALWARTTLAEGESVHNLVYMGMGEPLDNLDNVLASLHILMDPAGLGYSGRRITVSTSGVVPKLPRLGEGAPVNLAVSLNATTDEQRTRLIPINKVWDLAALIGALRAFPLPPRRRITIEYVLLRGVNDTAGDARRLVELLRGVRCKVNLIPFNPWPGAPYDRPEPARVDGFGAILRDAHYTVTIRYSKGDDIGAACGQLDGQVEAA